MSRRYAKREPRKPTLTEVRMQRRQPRYQSDPAANAGEKDWTPVEMWLCLHGESASGKAWVVSTNAVVGDAVYCPKALLDFSDPCGGFERWNAHCQKVMVSVHYAELPTLLAREKGFIGQRAA